MNSSQHNVISLPFDERNVAHVFGALSLSCLLAESASTASSTCIWTDDAFVLQSPIAEDALAKLAEHLVRGMRWLPGLGVDEDKVNPKAHHGILVSGHRYGVNPFISLAKDGADKSLFKTFSGQQDPETDLPKQIEAICWDIPHLEDWMFQRAYGISSWGLDYRVGSHALDLGFGSNDEGTSAQDPVYPVIELLALAGASLFGPGQALQTDESHIRYCVWTAPITTVLAPLALAGRIDGLERRSYSAANRGATYGKGAAYRYFPEATPVDETI